MLEHPWSAEEARGVMDSNYDLIAIRNGGVPVTYSAAKRGRREKS